MWFTSHFPDRIDRISPSGVITQYPVPSPFEQPYNITAGPDGAVWFAAVGGALPAASAGIGLETPSRGRSLSTPSLPEPPVSGHNDGPRREPLDHRFLRRIGSSRTTASGTTTVFPSTTYNKPLNIIAGPDGALWFTEDGMVEGGSGAIGRMDHLGKLQRIPPADAAWLLQRGRTHHGRFGRQPVVHMGVVGFLPSRSALPLATWAG